MSTAEAAASAKPVSEEQKRNRIVIFIALLLVVLGFYPGVKGDFVHDDVHQILLNPAIQRTDQLWSGLTQDVWAFQKTEVGEARVQSNYWRPVFVAWLYVNWQLFGAHPEGWHWTNLLIHFGCCALAYLFLIRLKVPWTLAAFVTWIMAIHPTRVESITWISGSPDPLLGLFLFGSLIAYLSAREKGGAWRWTVVLTLYMLALLSKEIALFFPIVMFGLELFLQARDDSRSTFSSRLPRALKLFAGFMAITIFFVFLRWRVMGVLMAPNEEAPSWLASFLTVPWAFFFYLRQGLWPFPPTKLSIQYTTATQTDFFTIHPVDPGNLQLATFYLPLIGFIAVLYLIFRLSKKDWLYGFGFIWFFFLLLPALNTRNFASWDIVHDRYLYMPLTGLFLMVGVALRQLAPKLKAGMPNLQQYLPYSGLVIALAFVPTTQSYAKVWTKEWSLWERATDVVRDQALWYSQLGEAYRLRFDQLRQGAAVEPNPAARAAIDKDAADAIKRARAAAEKAVQLKPDFHQSQLILALVEIEQRDYAPAESLLEDVLRQVPSRIPAREYLIRAYQEDKKFDQAIRVAQESIVEVPSHKLDFGIRLCQAQKMGGQDKAALQTIESLIPDLQGEGLGPGELQGWFFLANLSAEAGKKDQAQMAYQEFMKRTEGVNDPMIARMREVAQQSLKR